ncbi:hypothetical protein AYO20_10215 [Fonsecaea nubica]|uniref:Clr5 domain-containing protein n=1 Tax=Fonsecaea nubica TaxID=856822 RepID=A0A178CAY1_9EURO|nr:hypothetical protein AYO20_10215 [Fonsecaea nubica]OAL26162.1 hypothetical protein AYO20_10215 [Fonsecaea nubica]
MSTSTSVGFELIKDIVDDLYVGRKVHLDSVTAILAEVYGVEITKNQLDKKITKWGFRNQRVKTSSKSKPLFHEPPMRVVLPKDVGPPDVHKRREYILFYVQNAIDAEFRRSRRGEKQKCEFDPIWLTPGRGYKTSWTKLYKASEKLPEFAETGQVNQFEACVDEIFAGIQPAILGKNELNIMVCFWRVANDFLNAAVKRLNKDLLETFLDTLCDKRRELLPEIKSDPLALLCTSFLESPREERFELLRLGYERSITHLQYHYIDHNLTVPQMTTNYLMYWDRNSTRFPNLIADFEDLILYTTGRYGSDDWRTITCLHQFLYYTFSIRGDTQRSALIAETLYSRTQRIISTSKKITWNTVTNAFTLASEALMSWHSHRFEAGDVLRYFERLCDTLDKGDEECQRQATCLMRKIRECGEFEETTEEIFLAMTMREVV